MDDFISTGVLTRPPGTKILEIILRNTSTSLQFQSLYFYDHDSGYPVLVYSKNYFIPANGANVIEFPLLVESYGDSRNIILYEVVYGPINANVTATFFNI